jgi:hypothetical protein
LVRLGSGPRGTTAGVGWAVGSGAAVCWGRPVSAGPRWSGEREAAAGLEIGFQPGFGLVPDRN